jgi:hypothetical protein
VVVIKAADAAARFDRSTYSFLGALDGISEGAWRLRPTGEAWSLADTVEQVVFTNRLVRARLRQLLAASLPPGTPRFDDAAISAGMFETGAPPPIDLAEPKGRFGRLAEGIGALVQIHDDILAWARGTAADLRAYGLPHPVCGVFDGVQWVLFAAAETDNYISQRRALRADGDLSPQGPDS